MSDQDAARALAEKIVEMWINGQLATPHDAVRAVAAALRAERGKVWEEAAKIALGNANEEKMISIQELAIDNARRTIAEALRWQAQEEAR